MKPIDYIKAFLLVIAVILSILLIQATVHSENMVLQKQIIQSQTAEVKVLVDKIEQLTRKTLELEYENQDLRNQAKALGWYKN
jgi:cell shape-determining protein MreC